jgi:hypothetical protein
VVVVEEAAPSPPLPLPPPLEVPPGAEGAAEWEAGGQEEGMVVVVVDGVEWGGRDNMILGVLQVPAAAI